MDVDVKTAQESAEVEACPLDAPAYGRLPGLLAWAAAAVGVFTQPAVCSRS